MKRVKPFHRLLRMNPIARIFWFAVLLVIIGLMFPTLSLLIWVGVVIIGLYLIYFFSWLYQELP